MNTGAWADLCGYVSYLGSLIDVHPLNFLVASIAFFFLAAGVLFCVLAYKAGGEVWK